MKTERNIFIAFLLNLSFSVFEFIGGIITGSVAIMSDAVHDIGDAASIGISFFLEKKSKGKPDEKYTYNYDEQGKLQTVEMTYMTSGYGETYTYDENGNLVSKVKLSNNKVSGTETYTYDEKGNLLIEEHTFSSTQYYAKTTYTYDEQGRLLKKEGYNTNGGSSTVTYTCDEDGKLLTSDRIDSDGYTEKRTYSYTYDEYGNLLSESALDENTGVVYKTTYEYLVFYNPNFAEEPYTDPIGIFAPRMISSSMG